jgi:uroporphyrinogen decarboxylase
VNGAERLLAACRGEPVDAVPVWYMRQAGGRLPRYVALRERHSVIEIARTPALCAEVSAGAAETLGVDGAVMFADIMLLVEAMGVEVELLSAGPLIRRPLRSEADLAALRTVDPASDLGFVLEAIGLVRRELAGRAAVIGICGGPFTLAAYLIEGTPSRDQLGARAVMHGEPGTWGTLLDRLAEATVSYVRAQVDAGAQVVMVFDTWASSLTPAEYRRFVAPWTRRILEAVDVPTIHYTSRSSPLLEELAALGSSVLGIDSRQSLTGARGRLGERSVQGNLDPALVLAGWELTRDAARSVLAEGRRTGHVFGLGEAAPREADPALLRDLASFVHDSTAHDSTAHGGGLPEVSRVD